MDSISPTWPANIQAAWSHAQKLRANEAFDGEMDRPGYGVVNPAISQKTDGIAGELVTVKLP